MPPVGQGRKDKENGIGTGAAPPEKERAEAHGSSPLGRGADPGSVTEQNVPTARGTGGPAGLHGHGTPAARRGPSGLVDRENEDETQEARTGDAYPP